jgi:hypothetical protein
MTTKITSVPAPFDRDLPIDLMAGTSGTSIGYDTHRLQLHGREHFPPEGSSSH